jgi:HK97 family phage major capsid protein
MENLESAINGVNEKAAQINENQAAVKSLKEENEALKVEVKSTKDELVKVSGEQNAKIKELSDKVNVSEKEGMSLSQELKEKMSTVKDIAKKVSSEDLVLKANTLTGSITNNTESARIMEIGQLDRLKISAYDLFQKIPVSEGNNGKTISYADWDQASTVAAAKAIAEGAAYDESTAVFVEKTLPIEKIGDILPVSDEFYEDEARFAAELESFLTANVNVVIENQLINGTGSNNQLTGLAQTATAFNATGLTTVPTANMYDLLSIAPEMIAGSGAKYNYNVILMNAKSINKLRLVKDSTGAYVLPTMATMNGLSVNGMRVVECNAVADNQCFLGDSNYVKIYERTGVQVSTGYTGSQFASDLSSLKVKKRLAVVHRGADAKAFIYISDINAAITAITAP